MSNGNNQSPAPAIPGNVLKERPDTGQEPNNHDFAGVSLRRQQVPLVHISAVSDLSTGPLDKRLNRVIKRSFDILFSFCFIVAAMWIIIPVMFILIKLDSRGPLFFIQTRNKKNGAVFSCIKFRSMHVNNMADLLPAGTDDYRITRVGRWLRRFHIDELPQFFNVLAGDMSVVGPRPHMVIDNLTYLNQVRFYDYRHHVKPGVTGLAQVMGYTGAVSDIGMMEERIRLDLLYVRHWRFLSDLRIIVRTIGRVSPASLIPYTAYENS